MFTMHDVPNEDCVLAAVKNTPTLVERKRSCQQKDAPPPCPADMAHQVVGAAAVCVLTSLTPY